MVTFAKSMVDDIEFSPEDAGRSDPEFLVELCEVKKLNGFFPECNASFSSENTLFFPIIIANTPFSDANVPVSNASTPLLQRGNGLPVTINPPSTTPAHPSLTPRRPSLTQPRPCRRISNWTKAGFRINSG